MNVKYLKINAHDYCEGFLKDFKINIITGEVCSGTYIDYDSPKYGDPYEYKITDDNFPEHIICSPSDEEEFFILDNNDNVIGTICYKVPDIVRIFCKHIYEHTFELFFEKKNNKLYVKMFDKNIEELINQDNWNKNN